MVVVTTIVKEARASSNTYSPPVIAGFPRVTYRLASAPSNPDLQHVVERRLAVEQVDALQGQLGRAGRFDRLIPFSNKSDRSLLCLAVLQHCLRLRAYSRIDLEMK